MLQYTLRVRDLVHGTILFTAIEEQIINHPLFQRLRHIKQNDVAFYVYPSLNTSRFEHVLGTCRVTGMMAENLTKSPRWGSYFKNLQSQLGIASEEEFIELCRLYALLHDIGHLPLSHLFEMAVSSWGTNYITTIEDWTNVVGFKSLHEAFGAIIAKQIVQDISLSRPMQSVLTTLMTEKRLSFKNPLHLVQSLVASEIDADRTDFVQRDGRLAGGEYGNYDTKRLCDSVFIERDKRGWFLAFSEKAITSIEALLHDRYRTHVWIHFHHRVVATKMLVIFLIQKALDQKIITKEHFDPTNTDVFSMRDDVWLWNMLRDMKANGEIMKMIQRAVFFREKRNVLALWKNRPSYHRLRNQVKKRTRVKDFSYELVPVYKTELGAYTKTHVLMFHVPFKPIGERAIFLYSEREQKLTGSELSDPEVSRLVSNLQTFWEGEPREFVLLVGDGVAAREVELQKQWVKFTAQWIQR